MVFMEPKQLGHTPLITSYCNDLESKIGKIAEIIRNLMHYLSDALVAYTNMVGKFPVPTDPNYLVNSMLNVLDCYVGDWKKEDAKIPREAEEISLNALVFAHVWSIGVAMDETTRPKFDLFF